MSIWIGVDPGLTGALALLDNGLLLDIIDMPVLGGNVNAWELAGWFTAVGKVDRVAIEHVHAMPKQGVSSVFKFGRGCGVIEGVLAALERPVVYVAPTVWTRYHKVGAVKSEHRRRASELFPSHSHLFARVKDDGRADAALIAVWGAQQ